MNGVLKSSKRFWQAKLFSTIVFLPTLTNRWTHTQTLLDINAANCLKTVQKGASLTLARIQARAWLKLGQTKPIYNMKCRHWIEWIIILQIFGYMMNHLVVTVSAQSSSFRPQVCPDISVVFLLATYLLSSILSSSLSSDQQTGKLFPRSLATLSPFDNQ